jgi:Golgi apparatus protein 1
MVYEYQQLAAQDIRFDVPLADACHEDRQKLCGNVPPVRKRLLSLSVCRFQPSD